MIVLRPDATEEDLDRVVDRVAVTGAEARVDRDGNRIYVGARGDRARLQQVPWGALAGVDTAVPTLESLQLVGRSRLGAATVVEVGGVALGGGSVTVIAGPCTVENREQLFAAASAVKQAGAAILRGDAFKPRTSPYAFQGLGEKGLVLLAEARREFDMPFVAEVLDSRDVAMVSEYADMIRIGSRNMANFALLAEVGRQEKPVMLKRGMAATIEEWLLAAEYICKEGNGQVVLCERGIRTFEGETRNTLDISAVPVLRSLTHLPVVVDPSHGGGRRDLVAPLTRASIAAGADGVLIDVHADPDNALVDGAQAILPAEFGTLMDEVRALAAAMGRSVTG